MCPLLPEDLHSELILCTLLYIESIQPSMSHRGLIVNLKTMVFSFIMILKSSSCNYNNVEKDVISSHPSIHHSTLIGRICFSMIVYCCSAEDQNYRSNLTRLTVCQLMPVLCIYSIYLFISNTVDVNLKTNKMCKYVFIFFTYVLLLIGVMYLVHWQ